MTTDVKKSGAEATVRVEGRLDTVTAPVLDQLIQQELTGITALTLDLQELVYISSAGLRVLLGAQKKMQAIGSMKLKNVCEEVMEVLEMTGFADILVIE